MLEIEHLNSNNHNATCAAIDNPVILRSKFSDLESLFESCWTDKECYNQQKPDLEDSGHYPLLEKYKTKSELIEILLSNKLSLKIENFKYSGLPHPQYKAISALKAALLKEVITENKLTIYHDTGHAFIGLECTKCSSGQPAILYTGLYPGSYEENNLDEGENEFEENKEEGVGEETFFGDIGNIVDLLLGPVIILYSIKIISQFYPQILGESLQRYEILYEHGSAIVGGDSSIIHPTIKRKGDIMSYSSQYSSLDELTSKSFTITSEAAEKIFQRIAHLAEHSDSNYVYEPFSHNCLHFVQEMYSLAGLKGDHLDVMYPDSYPDGTIGAYKMALDIINNVQDIVHWIGM